MISMEFAEFIRTPKVDEVVLYQAHCSPVEGTLCVTGHHLMLSSRKDHHEELWLLHKAVDSVEMKLLGNGGTLSLICKDFKGIRLDIPSAEACINIASSIEYLSNIGNVKSHYPFFYRAMFRILEDGWTAFPVQSDYLRLKAATDKWRLSSVNTGFKICPSYPEQIIVPSCIDDATVTLAATFRQGSRFPVLAYRHSSNKTHMLRSSQPLTGPNNRRCKEDEILLNACLESEQRGYIVDTRTSAQAKLATAKGGGIESTLRYPQWKLLHQRIEPASVCQTSLVKFIEACNDSKCSMEKWLSRLEESGWMTNIKDILTAACVVAQILDKTGASVLVHGNASRDATMQVTALSQLLLDPNCRTVAGLEALIEREWICGGFAFSDRCSKTLTGKSKQESPMFLLFLECIWQIWRQYPCSFEFNEAFLHLLQKHSYYSPFGTFLGNSPLERLSYELTSKTVSLWSYVNRPNVISNYLNPLYEPNESVLWPSVAPVSLEVWSSMYQRWQVAPLSYDVSLMARGCEDDCGGVGSGAGDPSNGCRNPATISITADDAVWCQIAQIKMQDADIKSAVIKQRNFELELNRRQVAVLEREAIDRGFIQYDSPTSSEEVVTPN